MGEMLEAMTADQFQAWFVAYSLEGLGDDWEIGGTIAAAIQNEFLITRRMLADKSVGDHELMTADDYKPHGRRKPKQTTVAEGLRFASQYPRSDQHDG